MAIPIPSPLVEFILLGPLDDRRQLQDSPILGDVWVEYGKNPSDRVDLLIAPYRGANASSVAAAIEEKLDYTAENDPNVAFLQGLVAARLTFEEVLQVIIPRTKWWVDRLHKSHKKPADPARHNQPVDGRQQPLNLPSELLDRVALETEISRALSSALAWHTKSSDSPIEKTSAIFRFVALAGLILWAGKQAPPKRKNFGPAEQIEYLLKKSKPKDLVELLDNQANKMSNPANEVLVWQVSLNRAAMPALTRSVPAVKADAAKTLFNVNCRDITWAVIDSGIDGSHPAFRDASGNCRVRRSFDFGEFRKIVSLSNKKPAIRKQHLKDLAEARDARKIKLKDPPENEDEDLKRLAEDAQRRGPLHWDLVRRFVEVVPESPPASDHGTHVAGIIGASKSSGANDKDKLNEDAADGMCPDISLFDFRVLARDIRESEFAIIAALQFIRYLNEQDPLLAIHGANLSLSIPHDVRNFACGRTPICDECERLVESGVVVVAAAGNHGYKSFETKEGTYDSYAAFSITDPGNADSVITVGATHRFWPHTYGVSFFSSRGPTGDGRIKPDLVAPGERIRAPLPGGNNGGMWGDLDGTSMAAPHVSGAAAMLMARYSELIGQPRRIKQILCASATDLGRERSFQGSGMLDVLRAFQSI